MPAAAAAGLAVYRDMYMYEQWPYVVQRKYNTSQPTKYVTATLPTFIEEDRGGEAEHDECERVDPEQHQDEERIGLRDDSTATQVNLQQQGDSGYIDNKVGGVLEIPSDPVHPVAHTNHVHHLL